MISMRWTRRGAVTALLMALTPSLAAQDIDPPPGAAADPPPGAAGAPPPAAAEADPVTEDEPNWDEPVWEDEPEEAQRDGSGPGTDPALDTGPAEEETSDERRASLAETSGVSGATGLMRVMSAASGAPGTFRFSLLTGFYSGSGFLCPQCPDPDTGAGATARDEVDRVSAHLFLSATPTPFLEAYLGIFSHSTSTNRPVPQLKQVVGDWTLGAKAFMPAAEGQIFTLGGALDLGFSTGSGQVGLSGIGSINVGLHGLATADFSRRSGSPIPLRAHANLSYLFDNSSKLVEDFESTQGTIDRIERFSLDINRVDAIKIALGAEGLFDTARPFVEWSIDVPANRQSYLCLRNELQPGESCLRDRAVFSATPSRLTAGVRLMPWNAVPWWLDGMTVTGAMDVATGGASDFLMEVAPEVPWSVWFGLSYAADTRPRVEIQQVAAPVEAVLPPERLVHGWVVEKETTTGIADAQIRFEGRDLTGLISTAEGKFVTGSLEPGRYTLKITAPGYKESLCSVVVSDAPQAPAGAPATEPPSPAVSSRSAVSSSSPAAPGALAVSAQAAGGLAAGPASAEPPPFVTTVTCELEPVARVSNINGRVTDTTTGAPVGVASVRITDVLGRGLELQADEVGAFRFENVPPGVALITIQADGYLKSVTRLDVEPLQELDRRFMLTPIPAKPGVKRVGERLELSSPIAFVDGSSKLARDSLFTLQEVAHFLVQNPEIGPIEIQSHSSSDGLAATTLTAERANAVRDVLILHGVPAAQLSARGYGGSEAAKPGLSDEARRQNERIVFVLQAEQP